MLDIAYFNHKVAYNHFSDQFSVIKIKNSQLSVSIKKVKIVHTQILVKILQACVAFNINWKVVLERLVLWEYISKRKSYFGIDSLIWKACWSWLIKTQGALHLSPWPHFLGTFRLVDWNYDLFSWLFCVLTIAVIVLPP